MTCEHTKIHIHTCARENPWKYLYTCPDPQVELHHRTLCPLKTQCQVKLPASPTPDPSWTPGPHLAQTAASLLPQCPQGVTKWEDGQSGDMGLQNWGGTHTATRCPDFCPKALLVGGRSLLRKWPLQWPLHIGEREKDYGGGATFLGIGNIYQKKLGPLNSPKHG